MTEQEKTKIFLLSAAIVVVALIFFSAKKSAPNESQAMAPINIGGLQVPAFSLPDYDFALPARRPSTNSNCCKTCPPKRNLVLELPPLPPMVFPTIPKTVFEPPRELSNFDTPPEIPPYVSPTPPTVGPVNTPPRIRLFKEPNFGSKEVTSSVGTSNMKTWGQGLNDGTRSAIVESGQWELCVDAGFGGYCQVLGPGEYPNLLDNARPLYKNVSSFRPVQ